jgi:peptide/nickel transport system substrate-binding protein
VFVIKLVSSTKNIIYAVTILLLLSLSVPAAADAQEHPRGGTLVMEQPEDITHLVQMIEPGGAWYADYALFDRLVEVDTRTAETIPGLAESWELSSDRLTYTFHLYKNVKWHDGAKFSSADVKYTYDYIMQNDLPGKAFLEPTVSVETPDENTVVIRLSGPNSAFLAQLGTWTMFLGILPKHIYDVPGTPWDQNQNIFGPIGTGPFKFAELRKGEFAKFVRYDDYHKGRPYLDAIVWRIIPDVSTAIQMLRTNEIQLIGGGNAPPFSELDALSKIPGISVRGAPLGGEDVFALEFNSGNPDLPVHNVKVRKAICMAINRQEIEDKVFFGYTKVGKSIFTEDITWAFNPNAKDCDYDPAGAEKLLDEAGYRRKADGIRFKTKVEFGNYFGAQNQGTAEVLAQQLSKVGIDAQYTLYEWLVWYEKVKLSHDFEMSIFLDYAGPDPDVIRRMVHSASADDNGGQYSNPRVDELLDLAVRATDAERARYYFEIQEILADELPYIGLIDQDWWYALRADYRDLWFDPGVKATRLNPWKTWWEGAAPATTTTAATTPPTETTQMTETTAPPPPAADNTLLIVAAIAVILVLVAVFALRRRRKT